MDKIYHVRINVTDPTGRELQTADPKQALHALMRLHWLYRGHLKDGTILALGEDDPLLEPFAIAVNLEHGWSAEVLYGME